MIAIYGENINLFIQIHASNAGFENVSLVQTLIYGKKVNR